MEIRSVPDFLTAREWLSVESYTSSTKCDIYLKGCKVGAHIVILGMNTKSLFKSKTLVFNVIVAVTVAYPPASAFVAANPELTVGVLTFANFLLRMVTSKKVELFPSEY